MCVFLSKLDVGANKNSEEDLYCSGGFNFAIGTTIEYTRKIPGEYSVRSNVISNLL